jgi:hypothetical protein
VHVTAGTAQSIALWLRAGAGGHGGEEKKEGEGHHHGGALLVSRQAALSAAGSVLPAASIHQADSHLISHTVQLYSVLDLVHTSTAVLVYVYRLVQ